MNQDFNTNRLERYLFMARESGAEMVVVLTKADLSDDAELQLSITEAIAGETPVYMTSSQDGTGLDALSAYFSEGKTVVSLGSSGVGKSTMLNRIAGAEIMKTGEIRESDGRGKHTTTHRQLITLPSGAMFMDTPGMREIGLFDADEAVSDFYSEIEALVTECRFSDCGHTNEPGCAVKAAIRSGKITRENFEKYKKYKREALRTTDRMAYIEMQRKFRKTVINNKKIKY